MGALGYPNGNLSKYPALRTARRIMTCIAIVASHRAMTQTVDSFKGLQNDAARRSDHRKECGPNVPNRQCQLATAREAIGLSADHRYKKVRFFVARSVVIEPPKNNVMVVPAPALWALGRRVL
jgi:hypothetical protein